MRFTTPKTRRTLCSVSALATALALASPVAAQTVIDDEETDTVELEDNDTLEVTEDGSIDVDGDDAVEADGDNISINNDGTIRSVGNRAIDGREINDFEIVNSGTIEAAPDTDDDGSDAIDVSGSEGITITNSGSIIAGANDTKAVDGGDNLTVVNSGTIRSLEGEGRGVEGDDNLVITNLEDGVIEALGESAEAIESDGVGLTIVNDGLIRSEFDDAIDGGADVDITNNATGIIRGANNDGLELDNGVIVNAGLIESLSSDPDGDFILDADGNPTSDREIDAGIDFDAAEDEDASEDGMVMNLEGGIIRGDIGINTSSGATDPDGNANEGSQTIVNFGTIEGRAVNPETGRIDAVLLGAGDDEFQQWQTGVTIGAVDGGAGTDAAIFGNNTDEDSTLDLTSIDANFLNFESFTLLATGDGGFVLTGEGDPAFTVTSGNVTVEGTLGGRLTIDGGTALAVTEIITEDETTTGSIAVAAGNAVEVNLEDFTITNDGTIDAADGRAIEAGDVAGLTVTNNGTISASDSAINAGANATITNNAGALITTSGDADTIETGDNLTLINAGDITNTGDGRAIDVDGVAMITNEEGATISADNDDAIRVMADATMITNSGAITSGDDAIDGQFQNDDDDTIGADGLTVINTATGTITAVDKGIEGFTNLTVVNDGTITSTEDEAIEADGAGLNLTNNGSIISPLDDAVDGDDQVTIVNTGLIQGGENDGIELNSGTITNSGTIESLSSDPEGDFSDAALTNRELDAAIDFDGGGDDLDGLVTNLAGGVIVGDIGINASSGNFVSDGMGGSEAGSEANFGNQTIVNFGTITGRAVNPATGRTDAVLLSFGDDVFQQWQSGVVNGTVDGQDGDDTLIFGNDSADNITRNLTNITSPEVWTGFETIAFLDVGGGITLTGEGDRQFDLLGGEFTLEGTITDRVNVEGAGSLTITESGSVVVEADEDAIRVNVDNFTITNSGTITSGDDAIDGQFDGGTDGLTVINTATGVITAVDKGIEGGTNLTVVNDGTITSTADEAIEIDGIGLNLTNNGSIISPLDDAVDGDDQAVIVNTGLIQGGENDAIELNSGTITNSGTIESLSSDPGGDFSDAGLTNRELDAAIDFDGGGDDGDGLVTNEASGVIIGDIGINASSGNFVDDGMGGSEAGSEANFGNQTVVNFGSISGRIVNPATGRIDAVLLSFGDDEFQQWTGASVTGWVDLEAGDDTFILEGTFSSITGGVQGGDGDDTAILAGVFDADGLLGFETVQLGSTLGDTLNDLDIVGNRTITGNIVHTGIVNVDLGIDSLTTDGTITLQDTGVLNITTSQGPALAGQTVVVLGGSGLTNLGASVNIDEDDFLLDYDLVTTSGVSVLVNAINPLAGNADGNIAAFGGAVAAGANAGTFVGSQFAAFNDLGAAAPYAQALNDELPSLNDGVGREVFETGNLASQALNHHLKGEGSGIWGQIAVRGAQQDALSPTIDGYESDQLVFTLGGDIMTGENLRLGLLASYADIDIDDENAGGQLEGTQEVQSYRFGAYVAATVLERGFFNAELSYLTGDVETSRSGFFGPIGSDYDFDGFSGRATFGYDLLEDENIALIPSVGINAASISFDDAAETGGLGFLVSREDADFFEARFGAELSGQFSETVGAYIQGVYINDLTDNDADPVTLTSSQLPTFTVLPALREQDRFELSAGASFLLGEMVTIEVGYLGDFNDGYDAHAGRASARIAF